MGEFLRTVGLFAYATANHTFLMMYWIWLPGWLLSAYLFTRLHGEPLPLLLKGRPVSVGSFLWAGLLGVTFSADRRRGLVALADLLAERVPPPLALAFYLGSQHVVIYPLCFFMALVGGEFFAGQALGGVMMAAYLALLTRLIPKRHWEATTTTLDTLENRRWREQHATSPLARGWRGIVRYIGRELPSLWWPVLLGLLGAGIIGAAGRTAWWVDFSMVGGEGLGTALLNVILGAAIGVAIPLAPLGHLFIGAFLWKAYTLSFLGIIAFVLASAADLRAIRAYVRLFGPAFGRALASAVFASAILAALTLGLFLWAVGFEVTHTPLGHTVVEKLMNALSLGRPM
ncbi:MAG: permease [Nitrospinae bacterium]|nr:permease [Nitrospinota bacterium]